MKYAYSYLKERKVRGKVLFDAIKPYLESNDRFLDINCGYSPLAELILKDKYDILGFDINYIPINFLRKYYPKGRWNCVSLKDANFKGFSVFLLLGFSILSDGIDFKTFLNCLLDNNKPRIVLTEVYKNPQESLQPIYRISYNETLQLLTDKNYKQIAFGEYNAKMNIASLRIYSIWKKI